MCDLFLFGYTSHSPADAESGEENEIDFDDSEEEDEDEDENGKIKPVVPAASAVPALEVNLNEELQKFFDDDAEEVKAEDVKKLKKRAKRRLRQEKYSLPLFMQVQATSMDY